MEHLVYSLFTEYFQSFLHVHDDARRFSICRRRSCCEVLLHYFFAKLSQKMWRIEQAFCFDVNRNNDNNYHVHFLFLFFWHRKTAVMMMNMGGPSTIPEVEPFLNRLFLDQDIMQLKEGPAMRALAYVIVKRRLNRVQQQYKDIGGGSPIHRLSDQQGTQIGAVCRRDTIWLKRADRHCISIGWNSRRCTFIHVYPNRKKAFFKILP